MEQSAEALQDCQAPADTVVNVEPEVLEDLSCASRASAGYSSVRLWCGYTTTAILHSGAWRVCSAMYLVAQFTVQFTRLRPLHHL